MAKQRKPRADGDDDCVPAGSYNIGSVAALDLEPPDPAEKKRKKRAIGFAPPAHKDPPANK